MAKKAAKKVTVKKAEIVADEKAVESPEFAGETEAEARHRQGAILKIEVVGGYGVAQVVLPNGQSFLTKDGEVTRVPLPFGRKISIGPVAID